MNRITTPHLARRMGEGVDCHLQYEGLVHDRDDEGPDDFIVVQQMESTVDEWDVQHRERT